MGVGVNKRPEVSGRLCVSASFSLICFSFPTPTSLHRKYEGIISVGIDGQAKHWAQGYHRD